MTLKGKLAVVTGATAGIGEATAFLLAQKGCRLIITGRRDDRLESIKRRVEQDYKTECLALSFDVSNKLEAEVAIKENLDWFKETDFLINNAGLAKGVDLMYNAKFEDWETMIDTNIKGLLYMTRLLVPHMIQRKRGHIINLGSVAGRWVYPGGGVYCATKFAVSAISEGLRMDLNGKNIRVTNIEPGRVETEFSLVRLGDAEAAKKVYQDMTPLEAGDIAECIVWSLERPERVNIQEMVIFPTDQASITIFNKSK